MLPSATPSGSLAAKSVHEKLVPSFLAAFSLIFTGRQTGKEGLWLRRKILQKRGFESHNKWLLTSEKFFAVI